MERQSDKDIESEREKEIKRERGKTGINRENKVKLKLAI